MKYLPAFLTPALEEHQRFPSPNTGRWEQEPPSFSQHREKEGPGMDEGVTGVVNLFSDNLCLFN